MSKPRKKKRPPEHVLALPDLEQSKAAVLNTLTSKSGQHSYDSGHHGFRRLVLFRAAPGVQPDGRSAVQDLSRTEAVCGNNH